MVSVVSRLGCADALTQAANKFLSSVLFVLCDKLHLPLSTNHQLTYETLVNDFSDILELPRDVVTSMCLFDEEMWIGNKTKSRDSWVLILCLNAISYFQGCCGGNGCDIDFTNMTIRDRAKIDFHHLDESAKFFNVSMMAGAPSFLVVMELRKCIGICRNCHSGETHDQIQASKRARLD